MKLLYKHLFWIVIILSTIALIAVYTWRLWKLPFASSPEAFGLFGDYVGGVLGAFTGLVSVVFLFFTYKKQIEIFQEQKSQTELQQFENTFFNLLEIFDTLRQRLNNKEEKTEGLVFIHSIRALIEDDINSVCNEADAFDTLNALETRSRIEDIYKTAFIAESDQLGHYFRSLYHLLKYINEQCPKDKKKRYFDLVQAQMNTDELYLTCINGISNYGRKKLHPLLNNSSFLENLAIDESENIRKLVYFFYPNTKHKNPNGIRKNIVFVAGTEGTRKGKLSILLFKERIPARVVSFYGLLKRAGCNPTELLKNKDTLKRMLEKNIDPDYIHIIFCSFCQLNSDGTNDPLPFSIFNDVHPIAIVYLESPLDYMIKSIRQDDRIQLDDTSAEIYKQNEETAASDYAAAKDIPFYKFNSSDLTKAAGKIREVVAANS